MNEFIRSVLETGTPKNSCEV